MTPAELEECMKDLDQNKDNKISFDEFSSWWMQGQQGQSVWMRKLLSLKLAVTKVIDGLSDSMLDVVGSAIDGSDS